MNRTKTTLSKLRCFCAGVLFSLVPFVAALAQRATQIVRYSVTGVSQGQVTSGNGGVGTTQAAPAAGFSTTPETAPGTNGLNVSALANASSVRTGQTVVPVWQASYGITNNESNKKLSVSIDAPMPDGMELNANISAPPGADARGPVDIGTASRDVVTGIGTGNTGSLAADFSVASTATAPSQVNRKVTFTLISGA